MTRIFFRFLILIIIDHFQVAGVLPEWYYVYLTHFAYIALLDCQLIQVLWVQSEQSFRETK